jgi:superfamily II DNA helicase RecQ
MWPANVSIQAPYVWSDIQAVKYTHILLGPEQALYPRFAAILRRTEFNQKVAMVAIDELHMVGQWRDFRECFTAISRLWSLIPNDVLWFGCCYFGCRIRGFCAQACWF